MPPNFEGLEVHADKRGNGGYIRFELEGSMAASMRDQPNMVPIEYDSGYARIGMGARYTIRMLKDEF
jgi:hypothetical protein